MSYTRPGRSSCSRQVLPNSLWGLPAFWQHGAAKHGSVPPARVLPALHGKAAAHSLALCVCLAPLQDVADSCRTGAATDIIFGLALGYK